MALSISKCYEKYLEETADREEPTDLEKIAAAILTLADILRH